jgi:hypothetical protein
MKEAAISAAALLGLLAFAGIYNTNQSHRARRAAIVDEIDEVEELFEDESGNFMNDVANMTAENWREMQIGLGITEKELLPFEVDDEDIIDKQEARRRRKKGGAVNLNRFKLKDVPKLHDKMVEAHNFRMDSLLANFVDAANVNSAARMPVDQLDEAAAAAAHISNGEYPDYSGNDKTAPQVQKFLNEFGYNPSGTNLFNDGGAQVWFLIPAAVPLFGAESASHLSDYGEYWNFISSWKGAFDSVTSRGSNQLRMSIGLYHKGAVYSPRGTLYRSGRFPWGRIKNFYMRPRTTTSMPYVIPTAESLLQWIPRFGASSAAAGQDCYTIWFHQDFSADASQLLLTDQFAKVDQLYQLCNVVHVMVGFNSEDENAQAYAAALVPGLQAKVAKDPDFSGVFYADDLQAVNNADLQQKIFKYMTLIKARASCRIVEEGYVAPPSDMGGTAFAATAGAQGTAFPAATVTDIAATGGAAVIDVTEASDYGTEAPTVRGLLDEEPTEAPKIPEIDSCCGHDMFASVPYDSELRTCCEDGQPKTFTDDGSDPCMADLGDYGFTF